MKNNYNTIIPKEYYTVLWCISWLSMFSGIYALYRSHYDLALVPLGVCITSLNYWRYPDYSWRRYLDIFYVHSSLLYQIIRAYNSDRAIYYYSFLGIGIIFYPIGIYFYRHNNLWVSVLCHCQVHIFGNISNIILYSGKFEK